MIATLAALAMASAPAAQGDPARNLLAIQGMYEQSCQVKAYGSYDDLCNVLKKQMKEAEKAQKKQRSAAKAQPVADEASKPAEAPAAAAPAGGS